MANTEAIADILRRATDAGDVPGVVVAAATAEGPIFAGGFGVRDTASGAPMTADTVVWIASMTKAVTGACAMQLVEQGRLSLDGPIATVLPELGKVQVLEGFAADGTPRLRPARRPITLRHLLTHTPASSTRSGTRRWDATWRRPARQASSPARTPLCRSRSCSIPASGGTTASASTGPARRSRRSAARGSATTCSRTCCSRSACRTPGSRSAPRNDNGWRRCITGLPQGFVATDIELPQEPEFEMGGGGLYSTVGDYLRFTRMILNNGTLDGTRVLARETVATMSANAMGDLMCRALKTAAPPFVQRCRFHRRHAVGAELPDQSAAAADGPFGWIAGLGRVWRTPISGSTR